MQEAAPLIHNLTFIQATLEQACRRSHRDIQDISIMAVTKYAADSDVLALLSTGRIKHIGESRVQQAWKRWTSPDFTKYPVIKHFIGHLQTNKAAQAAQLFDFIDSIDNIKIAKALDLQAQKLNKQLKILLQIKLTDKESQFGVSLQNAPQLLQQMASLKHLYPCGYMAIAPQTSDAVLLRSLFSQVNQAFERDFPKGPRYLSLGMSEDFEIAIEEGSTLPRIGSKLFAQDLEEV